MPGKASDDIVVLEQKDNFLRIGVFTAASGRLNAKALEILPILDQPLEVLSRDIRQTLKGMGVQKARAYLILPRSSVIIRYLTIPSERPNEIREMLSLGLHQYIPYESHEVSFDFRVAEVRADGFSKVLLFSALESTVNEQIVLCEQAGLKVADVLCSTEAAWRGVADDDQGQGEVRLLVDIDARSTDVIAFSGDQLKFTRAVGSGIRLSGEHTVADELIDQLAADTKASVEAFSKEFPNTVISSVMVNGADPYTEKVVGKLEQSLNTRVTAADTKRFPVVWRQGSGMTAAFKEKGFSFLSLVGGALLASEGTGLSFLPASRRQEQLRKYQENQMIKAGGALLAALLAIALFFLVNLAFSGAELSNIEKQVKQIQSEAERAENMLRKLEVVAASYRSKTTMLDMLDELHRKTPNGITLTQLLLEEDTKIKIRGLAPKNHMVSEYISRLEESPVFDKVEHLGSQRKTEERQEFFEFTIAANMMRGAS